MCCWGHQHLWPRHLREPPRWIQMHLQPRLPATPQPGLLHRCPRGQPGLIQWLGWVEAGLGASPEAKATESPSSAVWLMGRSKPDLLSPPRPFPGERFGGTTRKSSSVGLIHSPRILYKADTPAVPWRRKEMITGPGNGDMGQRRGCGATAPGPWLLNEPNGQTSRSPGSEIFHLSSLLCSLSPSLPQSTIPDPALSMASGSQVPKGRPP